MVITEASLGWRATDARPGAAAIVRDHASFLIPEDRRVVSRSIIRDHMISMITADRRGRSTR
jgi:hypothetical protein